MRGSPPLHLALILVGFALIALPLIGLTSMAVPTTSGAPSLAERQPEHQVFIRLRFAHPPSHVTLSDAEQTLYEGQTELLQELSRTLIIPAEGLELSLTVKWPEGTPDTAVTLELEPDALDTQSQTRWSTGPVMEEVLPFVWK